MILVTISTQEYNYFVKGLYVCFKNLENGIHLGKSLFACHGVETLHNGPCRRLDLRNQAPVSGLRSALFARTVAGDRGYLCCIDIFIFP